MRYKGNKFGKSDKNGYKQKLDTAKSDEGFESKNLQFRIKMNEYRNRIKRIEEPYQPDAGNL